MKIAFTNISNTNSFKPVMECFFSHSLPTLFAPAFKGIPSDEFKTKTSIYDRALAKINDFTKEEYNSLTEEERIVLRETIKGQADKTLELTNIDEDIQMHQYAAEAIRNVLDKKYGEGKYVVIAIGRSLSSISNLLSMKIGKENVKNIPMSAMDRFYLHSGNLDCYEEQLQCFYQLDGFDKFKKYLESIGLSKEAVNNSGKNYVLMDYCASGMSLKAAYMILTSDGLLGNEKRNITTASISEIISATEYEDTPLRYIDEKLDRSAYKKYSTVERIYNDYNNIEVSSDYKLRLNDNSNNTALKKIKLFGFALLDSEFSGLETHRNKIKLKNISVETGKNSRLNPLRQYIKDVEEDSQFLYKIHLRIKKALYRLKAAEPENKCKKTHALNELCRKLKQNFETTYPLEYEYYKNQREFERLEDSLCKKDKEHFKPIIFETIKGFEKNSPLYNLFKETDEFEKSIIDEKSDSEYAPVVKMKKAYRMLNSVSNDFTRYMEEAEQGLNKTLQKDYYKNFRPSFLRLLTVVSKNFSQEYCEKFCNNIDNFYSSIVENAINKGIETYKEIENKTQKVQTSHSKETLEKIVNAQRKALESAKDNMYPF